MYYQLFKKMPIIRCKCLKCGKKYNAFIFPRKEKEKLIGFDLQNYPCPVCQSIKKGRYRDKEEKIKSYNSLF